MASIGRRWSGVLLLAVMVAPLLVVPTAGAAGNTAARPAYAEPAKRVRIPRGQGERLRRADLDRDGYLSRAEAQNAAPHLAINFDAIDANRDGKLSAQEIRSFGRSRAATRMAGRSVARAPGVATARTDAVFFAADADGDGQLSRAEAELALPRVASKFERMDADRDGRLSIDEFRAWIARRNVARAAKSPRA